jgi:hypothetical protein
VETELAAGGSIGAGGKTLPATSLRQTDEFSTSKLCPSERQGSAAKDVYNPLDSIGATG